LPTQLYEKFRNAVSEIEGAIESTRKFDPSFSSRRFRLARSDIGEASFLPPIMTTLQNIAPDVGIDIVAVDITRLADWLTCVASCSSNLVSGVSNVRPACFALWFSSLYLNEGRAKQKHDFERAVP
jgi:hypothetical protein